MKILEFHILYFILWKNIKLSVRIQKNYWAAIWKSSKLNYLKYEKSKTLKFIHSFREWGRINFCSWLSLAWSWSHNSVGSLICMYQCRKAWSSCLWRIRSVCHIGADRAVRGPSYVIGIKYLSYSSAARTTYALLIQSRKFVPSGVSTLNNSGWSLASAGDLWVVMVIRENEAMTFW